jgi:hypothetical protein
MFLNLNLEKIDKDNLRKFLNGNSTDTSNLTKCSVDVKSLSSFSNDLKTLKTQIDNETINSNESNNSNSPFTTFDSFSSYFSSELSSNSNTNKQENSVVSTMETNKKKNDNYKKKNEFINTLNEKSKSMNEINLQNKTLLLNDDHQLKYDNQFFNSAPSFIQFPSNSNLNQEYEKIILNRNKKNDDNKKNVNNNKNNKIVESDNNKKDEIENTTDKKSSNSISLTKKENNKPSEIPLSFSNYLTNLTEFENDLNLIDKLLKYHERQVFFSI